MRIDYNNPVKRVFNYTLEDIEMKESKRLNSFAKIEVLKKLKKEIKNKTVFIDRYNKVYY